MVYSTYLGGSGLDFGSSITVDVAGDAYVTGPTFSSDFPVTPGAFQTTVGGPIISDAFITKLSADGSALVYSTYLGGTGGGFFGTYGSGIAVDLTGCAYVTGNVSTSNFPTTAGALETALGIAPSPPEAAGKAFVSKLSATGSQLLYSTYFGGNVAAVVGQGIALDGLGNAYVTGATRSSNFPITPGVFQTVYGGGVDAYVSKFNLSSFVATGPVTTVTLNGPAGNYSWYVGTVTGTLSATDAYGMVSATYYSVDGGPTLAYGAPFPISTDGIHRILFYSIDTAGRQEAPHGQTIKIDATAPVTHVAALPVTAVSPNFSVQWSGTDALSGLRDYTVYVSENNGPFSPWLSQTTTTQKWFAGFLGHTYRFYSAARDLAGNVEVKTVADAFTTVPAQMAANVNGDGQINCADIAILKASFGKRTGQPGFDARADVNHDGIVDVRDLATVSQKLIPGTTCP